MDEPCVSPDALPRPVANRGGQKYGTEGNMQKSLCIEELKLDRYSEPQLSPEKLARSSLLLWHFDVIFVTILLLRSSS